MQVEIPRLASDVTGSAMQVRIVVEEGTRRKRAFQMRSQTMTIGRKVGCDLRIPSASVSRIHCRLRIDDGLLFVKDMGSVNGTYLNGEAVVGEEIARPGDRLKVGPVTFIIEYEMTAEAVERLAKLSSPGFEVIKEEEEDLPTLSEADAQPPVEEVEVQSAGGQAQDLLSLEDISLNLPPEQDLRDLLSRLEEADE